MNGKSLNFLRTTALMSKEELAEEVDVSANAIAMWEEDADRLIPKLYQKTFREIFEEKVLKKKITDIVSELFELVPSEMVALWLVREEDIVLLPTTVKYKCFYKNKKDCQWCTLNSSTTKCNWKDKHCFRGDFFRKVLKDNSMTTTPLHTDGPYAAKEIVLYGEAIANFKALKRKPGRENDYLYGIKRSENSHPERIVHSLYHVPHFVKKNPICLLAFENKLNNSNDSVVPCWDDGGIGFSKKYYTVEDQKKIQRFIKSDALKPIIDAMVELDYIQLKNR